MTRRPVRQPTAFTLIELSVVLVVLGLLVGGILLGRSLIRQSQINGIVTDYNKLANAVDQFRTQYQSLPGDMLDAQEYWGVAHVTPGSCITTASTGSETCNGNGDGAITFSNGSNEHFRFWQHLVNAGYLEGSYSGIAHGTSNTSATKVNSPAGRGDSALWFVANWASTAPASDAFTTVYNNVLELGRAVADSDPSGSLLNPTELWNLDKKVDDGQPGRGKLVARQITTCTNASGTPQSDLDTTYKLTNTDIACSLVFVDQF